MKRVFLVIPAWFMPVSALFCPFQACFTLGLGSPRAEVSPINIPVVGSQSGVIPPFHCWARPRSRAVGNHHFVQKDEKCAVRRCSELKKGAEMKRRKV